MAKCSTFGGRTARPARGAQYRSRDVAMLLRTRDVAMLLRSVASLIEPVDEEPVIALSQGMQQ